MASIYFIGIFRQIYILNQIAIFQCEDAVIVHVFLKLARKGRAKHEDFEEIPFSRIAKKQQPASNAC